MRRRVGYCKLGRSMPLSLEKCGTLGGDVEMVPTLKLLAERHPDVDFVLIGRNSGERPEDVDLSENVSNPWIEWQPRIRDDLNRAGLNHADLAIEKHQRARDTIMKHVGPEFARLDGVVMWIGQHGTTNTPLPSIGDRSKLTKPQDWATLYASYLLAGINLWRDVDPLNREPVLLNADPRNYVKFRDGKWPLRHSVLSQYTFTNTVKHERYGAGRALFNEFLDAPEVSHAQFSSGILSQNLGYEHDGELWKSRVHNVYSRLEVSALVPGSPYGDTIRFSDDFDRPHDFGVVINETRREVNAARARVNIVKEWVLPLEPGFLRGKWSDKSLRELGVDIQPVPQLEYISLLQSARCTLTTPSSGSGWATLKPWEAFAAGVVCFFQKDYDDQVNILGDAPTELRRWLRVSTPEDLRKRVKAASESRETWLWLVRAQREHFNNAVAELRWLKLIEERLEL